MKWSVLVLIIFTSLHGQLHAQEILLMAVKQAGETLQLDSSATLLSSFNPNNKNITPAFIDDNIYGVSANFPDKSQQDLWLLDLKKATIDQLTSTSQNETHIKNDAFKPHQYLLIKSIDSTQNALWFYPKNKKDQGNKIFTAKNTIINDLVQIAPDEYALSISEISSLEKESSPNKLLLLDINEKYPFVLTNKIAPQIKSLDGNIYFIHQTIASTSYLKKRLPSRNKPISITVLPKNCDVFCPVSSRAFIAAVGSKLYYYHSAKADGWKPIIDLGYLDVKQILSIDYKDNQVLLTVRFHNKTSDNE